MAASLCAAVAPRRLAARRSRVSSPFEVQPGGYRAEVSAADFLLFARVGAGGASELSAFGEAGIFVATSSVISTAGSMLNKRALFLGITMLSPRAAATSRRTGLACSRN